MPTKSKPVMSQLFWVGIFLRGAGGWARSGSASGAFWRSVGVESSCLEWPSAPSPPAVLQSVGVQASDETAPKTHPPAP